MKVHLKSPVTADTVYRHLVQWFTVVVVMVHVGLATVIFTGGAIRFTKPTYNYLVTTVDGEVWVWGALIFLSAVLMSVPFRWSNILGLWIGMVWHIVWMSCLSMAVLTYPTASGLTIPLFGGFALLCAGLLTARVLDKTDG